MLLLQRAILVLARGAAPRPRLYKNRALTDELYELGQGGRIRTSGLSVPSRARWPLRYTLLNWYSIKDLHLRLRCIRASLYYLS